MGTYVFPLLEAYKAHQTSFIPKSSNHRSKLNENNHSIEDDSILPTLFRAPFTIIRLVVAVVEFVQKRVINRRYGISKGPTGRYPTSLLTSSRVIGR